MAKDRMDVLELLRKEAPDADLDFLREGLRVLIQAVMEAEAATKTGDRLWRAQLGADHLPQRLPGPALGHPRARLGAAGPEGAGGELLPLPA